MLAWITFGEWTSAHAGDSTTRLSPNQSAILRIVPTLPGSWTPSRASVSPRSSSPGAGSTRRIRPMAKTVDGVGKWLVEADLLPVLLVPEGPEQLEFRAGHHARGWPPAGPFFNCFAGRSAR